MIKGKYKMSIKFRQLRKMAEQYRRVNPLVSIGKAVHEADKAYELYREAEAEVTLEIMFESNK